MDTYTAQHRRVVMAALLVSTFLTAMDATVMSTAMPTIINQLGDIQLLGWVFAVYTLTMAVSTPIWGKLSDLFGRKRIYIVGTSLFLIGSMLSGTSHSMTALIWFRCFQGIGAGAVSPITMTITGDLYDFEGRAKVQGLFSAVWGISGVLGPLIGGSLVEWISWRWIFYINIPIGIVAMVMIFFSLREQPRENTKQIDYLGVATFTAGMTGFLYWVQNVGGKFHWYTWESLCLLIGSLLVLSFFLWAESRAADAMLPLHIFRIRIVSVADAASMLTSAVLVACDVYIPIWIQGLLGGRPTDAGLTLAAMSFGWPLGATIGGRAMVRYTSRRVAIVGQIFIFMSTIALGVSPLGTTRFVLTLLMFTIGLGFGLAFTTYGVTVQSAVRTQVRGAATASQAFVQVLGQTIGIAAFGGLLNHFTHASGQGRQGSVDKLFSVDASHLSGGIAAALKDLLYHSVHVIFVICIALALLAFVVTWMMPRQETLADDTPSLDNGEGLPDSL